MKIINPKIIDKYPDTPYTKKERDSRDFNSIKIPTIEIIKKLEEKIDTNKLSNQKEYFKKFVTSDGFQKIDTSFLGTNESLKICLKKLENSLPNKEDNTGIFHVDNFKQLTIKNKGSIEVLKNTIKSIEKQHDMLNRVFINDYPINLENNLQGYILSGSKGTGKTTLLLTHFAGDLVRAFVTDKKIIYLDWTILNNREFWLKNYASKLLFGIKTVYINDLFNSKIKSGFQGEEIKDGIRELIHYCNSNDIRLNITTNKTSSNIKEMLNENSIDGDDELSTIIDRLPKTIIEFKGKSFRNK